MRFVSFGRGFYRKGVAFKQSFRHESATGKEGHEDEDSGFSGMLNIFGHIKMLINVMSRLMFSKSIAHSFPAAPKRTEGI